MKKILFTWLKFLALIAMTFVLANDVSFSQTSERFIEIIESEAEQEEQTKEVAQLSIHSVSLIDDGGEDELEFKGFINQINFDSNFLFNSLITACSTTDFFYPSRPLYLLNCALVVYE